MTSAIDATVSDLLSFLHQSPTPYHAVVSATQRLEAAGFTRLEDDGVWDTLSPGRYHVVSGGSALYAWVVPEGRRVAGFRMAGAHTDSPNLRLKPQPALRREGYEQLAVEVYGGVLLNSWLDRELGLAGRVFVREATGTLVPRLVTLAKPVLRIPQLAIHLDREVNERGLLLNKQTHMPPILGLLGEHATDVGTLCAHALGISRDRIAGHELMLHDLTPPALGGAQEEFLFSGRLDNLAMCHAAIRALLDAAPSAAGGDLVPFIALFDHEEVGSESATGAGSAVLPRLLERIVLATGGDRTAYLRALAGSLCVSADMAHAVHPNYADRHEPGHRVAMNGGPVIKVNAQQRYATSAATAALFAELCREVDVPVQHYAHRTDLPCGSTIGPIVSTHLGVRTVDVGCAMLSMHSAREMTGTKDPERIVRVLARFFSVRDTLGR